MVWVRESLIYSLRSQALRFFLISLYQIKTCLSVFHCVDPRTISFVRRTKQLLSSPLCSIALSLSSSTISRTTPPSISDFIASQANLVKKRLAAREDLKKKEAEQTKANNAVTRRRNELDRERKEETAESDKVRKSLNDRKKSIDEKRDEVKIMLCAAKGDLEKSLFIQLKTIFEEEERVESLLKVSMPFKSSIITRHLN